MLFVLGLIANIVPSVILFLFLRNRISDDKEYHDLCDQAMKKGLLAVFPVMLASFILTLIANFLHLSEINANLNIFYRKFIVLGFAEELVKFILFKKLIKNNPYKYNWLILIAIMTIIGAGFGICEDFVYAIGSGPIHMIIRGLTAMHAGFGFVMGYYQGKSYYTGKKLYAVLSFIIPLLMHGIYDYTLNEEVLAFGEWIAVVPVALAFICFILFIYMFIFILRAKKKDKYLEELNI